jgi:hypothetical protein
MDENGQLTTLRSQLRRDKTIRHLLGETPPAASSALEPAAELASEA